MTVLAHYNATTSSLSEDLIGPIPSSARLLAIFPLLARVVSAPILLT